MHLLIFKKTMSEGLDVYQNKPDIIPDLFKLENVILLQHIKSATEEVRISIVELLVKNFINVLKGKPVLTSVH